MNTLEIAKMLGRAIQEEESYTAIMVAKQNNDEDEELQNKIGQFNLVKMNLGAQMQKEEADQDAEKVQELNRQMRALYEEITANENMKAYEAAKKELDGVLNKIMQILSLAANGHDVDAIDLNGEIASCAGDCGSCGGCH